MVMAMTSIFTLFNMRSPCEEAEYLLKHLELHERRIDGLRKKIQKEAKMDEDMGAAKHSRGRQPVQQGGAGKQLYRLRPPAGLFGDDTEARAYFQARERVPAGASGAGGLVCCPFQVRRGFAGTVPICNSVSGGKQKEDYCFDRPPSCGTHVRGAKKQKRV
jgi:hypothetical protein